MIIVTEGKPGEGMSYKSILRIVGTYLRKRLCPLPPAQAQAVLNAVLERKNSSFTTCGRSDESVLRCSFSRIF